MKKMLLAAILFLLPLASGAEQCPPGTVEVRRETAEDGHLRLYCRQISELSTIEIATLNPSVVDRLTAEDKAALKRRQSVSYPSIDPKVYTTKEWAAFARRQQRRLIARRAFLMRQESQLQERNRDFIHLIESNDALASSLIEDNMGYTLTLIGALSKVIARDLGLPQKGADQINVLINTALAGLHSAAAAHSKSIGRESEKITEAAIRIKNLLLTGSKLPVKERDALIRATDAALKLSKIAQRWGQGESFDWQGVARSADDCIDALTEIPSLEYGKIARSTVQMAMAQYTLGCFEEDQAELTRAYREHKAAQEYLSGKIAKIDEWLSLYRRSLPSN
jgi:hypothetical protein